MVSLYNGINKTDSRGSKNWVRRSLKVNEFDQGQTIGNIVGEVLVNFLGNTPDLGISDWIKDANLFRYTGIMKGIC